MRKKNNHKINWRWRRMAGVRRREKNNGIVTDHHQRDVIHGCWWPRMLCDAVDDYPPSSLICVTSFTYFYYFSLLFFQGFRVFNKPTERLLQFEKFPLQSISWQPYCPQPSNKMSSFPLKNRSLLFNGRFNPLGAWQRVRLSFWSLCWDRANKTSPSYWKK